MFSSAPQTGDLDCDRDFGNDVGWDVISDSWIVGGVVVASSSQATNIFIKVSCSSWLITLATRVPGIGRLQHVGGMFSSLRESFMILRKARVQ